MEQNQGASSIHDLFDRFVNIMAPAVRSDKLMAYWPKFRAALQTKPLDYASIYSQLSYIQQDILMGTSPSSRQQQNNIYSQQPPQQQKQLASQITPKTNMQHYQHRYNSSSSSSNNNQPNEFTSPHSSFFKKLPPPANDNDYNTITTSCNYAPTNLFDSRVSSAQLASPLNHSRNKSSCIKKQYYNQGEAAQQRQDPDNRFHSTSHGTSTLRKPQAQKNTSQKHPLNIRAQSLKNIGSFEQTRRTGNYSNVSSLNEPSRPYWPPGTTTLNLKQQPEPNQKFEGLGAVAAEENNYASSKSLGSIRFYRLIDILPQSTKPSKDTQILLKSVSNYHVIKAPALATSLEVFAVGFFATLIRDAYITDPYSHTTSSLSDNSQQAPVNIWEIYGKIVRQVESLSNSSLAGMMKVLSKVLSKRYVKDNKKRQKYWLQAACTDERFLDSVVRSFKELVLQKSKNTNNTGKSFIGGNNLQLNKDELRSTKQELKKAEDIARVISPLLNLRVYCTTKQKELAVITDSAEEDTFGSKWRILSSTLCIYKKDSAYYLMIQDEDAFMKKDNYDQYTDIMTKYTQGVVQHSNQEKAPTKTNNGFNNKTSNSTSKPAIMMMKSASSKSYNFKRIDEYSSSNPAQKQATSGQLKKSSSIREDYNSAKTPRIKQFSSPRNLSIGNTIKESSGILLNYAVLAQKSYDLLCTLKKNDTKIDKFLKSKSPNSNRSGSPATGSEPDSKEGKTRTQMPWAKGAEPRAMLEEITKIYFLGDKQKSSPRK